MFCFKVTLYLMPTSSFHLQLSVENVCTPGQKYVSYSHSHRILLSEIPVYVWVKLYLCFSVRTHRFFIRPLESMKCLCSLWFSRHTDRCLFFVNTLHLLSSTSLFPSSLFTWMHCQAPFCPHPHSNLRPLYFFHPLSLSHKMSVIFPASHTFSPPFFAS